MTTDTKAIEEFYCFWKWEYQRRNAEYKEDYYALVEFAKERLNMKDVDEENIVRSVNTYSIFHRNPDERPRVIFRPSAGMSCPSIDKEISEAFEYFYQIYKIDPIGPLNGPTINEVLSYIVDNNQPHEMLGAYYSPSSQYIFQTIGIKKVISYHMDNMGTIYGHIFDTDFSPSSQYIFQTPERLGVEKINSYGIDRTVFEIDFNKPLKSTISAITYFHAKAQKPPDDSPETKAYEQNMQAIWSNIIKHFICKDKPQKFKLDNRPRAVGLWLWDYTKKNNCKSTTAIKAFREMFTNDTDEIQPIENLGYNADTEDRVFSRLLTGTQKCIEAMEVLRIS